MKYKRTLFCFALILYPALAMSIFPGPINDMETNVLPKGATFNSTTGQFSWTPDKTQAGDYRIKFKACDTHGACDEEIITITVNNVP